MKRALAKIPFAAIGLAGLGAFLDCPTAVAEPTQGGPYDYSLQDSAPLPVIVLAPTGTIVDSTVLQVASTFGSALSRNTSLEARLVEEERGTRSLAECEGSLRCFVQYVRVDYDPTHPKMLRAGGDSDWDAEGHRSRLLPWNGPGGAFEVLAKAGHPAGRFLVVFSAVRQAGKGGKVDRLRAVLVDTDVALHYIHEANAANEGHDAARSEQVEGQIAESAVKARAEVREVSSDAELKGYLTKLVEETFRPAFEAAELWDPYGELTLRVDRPDVEIEIDGVKVGATKPGRTRIGHVRAGRRTVRLSAPDFLPAEATVVVERHQLTTAEIQILREPNEVARVSRQAMLWGGVGLTVVGAAITAYAIHKASSSNVQIYNLYQGAAPAASKEFYKFGMDENPARPDVDPRGKIPIAPVGYSLGAAGLTWSLTTLLMNDEDTIPWLEGGLGLAAGVTAFLASVLLDHDAIPPGR